MGSKDDGKKYLVEPRIQGEYRKFNSNTGWVENPGALVDS